MKELQVEICGSVFLFFFFVVVGLSNVRFALGEELLLNSLPKAAVILNHSNFDRLVFPFDAKTRQPWIIILCRASSSACNNLVSSVTKQSSYLNTSHASIGLLDLKNQDIVQRYTLRNAPGIYYTTGRQNIMYLYDNKADSQTLLNFSVRLMGAHRSTSIAEDVTDPRRFVELAEKPNKPAFFVFRPMSSRGEDWVNIIDSVMSLGKADFFVIDESNLPSTANMSVTYQRITTIAHKCMHQRSSVGPNDIVLVSSSDRFLSPWCYSGTFDSLPNSTLLPLSLYLFFRQNSLCAVESLDEKGVESFRWDSRYVGIVVVSDSESGAGEAQIVPTLRSMVQSSNEKLRAASTSLSAEMNAPRIIWTFVEATSNAEWLRGYGVDVTNLPEVVVIDIARNRFFRTRKLMPEFEAVKKATPWIPDGPQSQLLASFSDRIVAGQYRAEKLTTMGYAAEYLSSIPGLQFVYEKLHNNDAMFVSGIISFFVFIGGIIVLLVTDDEPFRGKSKASASPSLAVVFVFLRGIKQGGTLIEQKHNNLYVSGGSAIITSIRLSICSIIDFCFCFPAMKHVLFFLGVFLCFMQLCSCETGSLRGAEFAANLPRGVVYLSDSNFYDNVFPDTQSREPWIIIFHSPGCSHCKRLIPQLLNASHALSNIPHAKIGLINSKTGELTKRYNIRQYPDVYYTTGRTYNKGKPLLLKYCDANTPFALMSFSIRLLAAQGNTSIAEDVTDPRRFVELAEKPNKPAFFVFRPMSSRGEDWVNIIDSVMSLGKADFFVIDESNLPSTANMSVTYQRITTIAHKCMHQRSSVGPNDIVLVSSSDRFLSPWCYSGLWNSEISTELVHPTLKRFFMQNSRKAVEHFDARLFFSLEEETGNYLGIVVVSDSESGAGEAQIVPTLRSMVQSSNEKLRAASTSLSAEMNAPRIIWTFVEATSNAEWLRGYGVDVTNLPEVVVIDIARNRFFRTRKLMPEFEAVKKATPWIPDGPQSQLLASFSDRIVAGQYRAEKLTTMGYAAEYLSSIPGLEYFYSVVGFDDSLFVVGVGALIMCFLAVIVLSCVPESGYRVMLRASFCFRCALGSVGKDFYGRNFTVSQSAWKRIDEVNKTEGFSNNDRVLRLAIESGGCHGYLYKFAFEDVRKCDPKEDVTISAEETGDALWKSGSSPPSTPQVVLDRHSISKLQNAVIDFHSELKGSAFVVIGNELVDESCACAMSFSIKKNKSPSPVRRNPQPRARAPSTGSFENETYEPTTACFRYKRTNTFVMDMMHGSKSSEQISAGCDAAMRIERIPALTVLHRVLSSAKDGLTQSPFSCHYLVFKLRNEKLRDSSKIFFVSLVALVHIFIHANWLDTMNEKNEKQYEENEPFEGSLHESKQRNVIDRVHDIIQKKLMEKSKHSTTSITKDRFLDESDRNPEDHQDPNEITPLKNTVSEAPDHEESDRRQSHSGRKQHSKELSFEVPPFQSIDPFCEDPPISVSQQRTPPRTGTPNEKETETQQQYYCVTDENGDTYYVTCEKEEDGGPVHFPECEEAEANSPPSLASAPETRKNEKTGILDKLFSVFKKKKKTFDRETVAHGGNVDIQKETRRLAKKEHEHRKLISSEESNLFVTYHSLILLLILCGSARFLGVESPVLNTQLAFFNFFSRVV
eukprot:gene5523-3983_t